MSGRPAATADRAGSLLEVNGLSVEYRLRGGGRRSRLRAVDGIDFAIETGETLGLVGESGCGKTTAGLAVCGLVRPSSGVVRFQGRVLSRLGGRELREARRELQIVFQDPFSALNPRLPVGESIGEPLLVRDLARGAALRDRVAELLGIVGLGPEAAGRYPHQFSGGQRQRLVIARALALRPRLIVCDEPVSALDVSVRSQILNLLGELKQRFGVAYLFISHDLSVIRHIADRVGVMYLGRLVESAPTRELFTAPRHPYTQALMSAIPLPDPRRQRGRKRIALEGELPSPARPPAGCRFHTRCPMAIPRCAEIAPNPFEVAPSHLVACLRHEETRPAAVAEAGGPVTARSS